MSDKETKYWYALYVRSRAEKKVVKQLEEIGVEAYLPLITQVKQWSDRRKKVEEPLFKSYVFVHSTHKQHIPILNVYGVIKFVTFEHEAVVVPDNQIVAIKRYVEKHEGTGDVHIDMELQEGEKVRIVNGPMRDLTGILYSVKDKRQLLVFINAVGYYLPISIPRTKVERIDEEEEETH